MVKCLRQVTVVGIGFASLCLLAARPAYAYLDPGTGSYMLQLLVGVLIGAAFAIRFYWKKIWSIVSDRFSRHQRDDEETE
jgi:hypothetical protein